MAEVLFKVEVSLAIVVNLDDATVAVKRSLAHAVVAGDPMGILKECSFVDNFFPKLDPYSRHRIRKRLVDVGFKGPRDAFFVDGRNLEKINAFFWAAILPFS